MREVYRAPSDVSAEIHCPWAVWDLITLKEQSPNPESDPDKFVDYFLTALRAQKANWADTKVLLQKLISPAKFRDIMAFWDWGDDLKSNPTYPKRRDGTGNIAEGLAGNDARTAELVKDIKNAFPRKPPLQRLEKCVFEKGDTAYTFMDRTRDAFTHIMGAGAADDVAFKPFILSHYVNHLPPVVTQKIKATVGWESFTLNTVCAHAAHHLSELGSDKKEKKERLLALQLKHLESRPNKQRMGQTGQVVTQVEPGPQGVAPVHRGGDRRHYNNRHWVGGEVKSGPKPCSRCGGYGHFARFCMAVMTAPGQNPPGVQGQLPMGLSTGQQIALGLPPTAQGALNVYAPPFYQPAQPFQQASGHQQQQQQQYRTA